MEASTTIKDMLHSNKIFVPTYQRAYAWDLSKHVKVFLSDLEEYNQSITKSPYYFGHFLLEEKAKKTYGVIDGQQRLTTITICLAALFSRLKQLKTLSDSEKETYEDIIKRNASYRFDTVDYDKQCFRDYVIDGTKQDKNGIETESARRFVEAYDFFKEQLSTKGIPYLTKMLGTIQDATCTVHTVKNESEAIQMFIFQNNRGKKPSNLEIIKAQFMFNVHLYAGASKEELIEEIKNRFEKIYKSISAIEFKMNEDDILNYTLKVHFNSLWEENPVERINKLLIGQNNISFIKEFTLSLATSFEHLRQFLGTDEKKYHEIHSLVTLGNFAIAVPFILKAYKLGLSTDHKLQLVTSLESMILRHKLIGTKAVITSRLNDVYQKFTGDISDIVARINWMKVVTAEWWWAYTYPK